MIFQWFYSSHHECISEFQNQSKECNNSVTGLVLIFNARFKVSNSIWCLEKEIIIWPKIIQYSALKRCEVHYYIRSIKLLLTLLTFIQKKRSQKLLTVFYSQKLLGIFGKQLFYWIDYRNIYEEKQMFCINLKFYV